MNPRARRDAVVEKSVAGAKLSRTRAKKRKEKKIEQGKNSKQGTIPQSRAAYSRKNDTCYKIVITGEKGDTQGDAVWLALGKNLGCPISHDVWLTLTLSGIFVSDKKEGAKIVGRSRLALNVSRKDTDISYVLSRELSAIATTDTANTTTTRTRANTYTHTYT